MESVMERMRGDLSAGNLTFPGVKERIVPVEGSIETLRPTWNGCGFGQQRINTTCSN